MINVVVRYHGILRRLTSVEKETMIISNATLLAVLEDAARRHGPQLRTALFSEDGDISSHLVIFRNQQLVPHAQRGIAIADGDELMLFPAISGGVSHPHAQGKNDD